MEKIRCFFKGKSRASLYRIQHRFQSQIDNDDEHEVNYETSGSSSTSSSSMDICDSISDSNYSDNVSVGNEENEHSVMELVNEAHSVIEDCSNDDNDEREMRNISDIDEVNGMQENYSESDEISDSSSNYSGESAEEKEQETESDSSSASDDDSYNAKDFGHFEDSFELDEPLYAGAPLTVAESVIASLTLSLRHKLSGVCLADILGLISLHCPSPNKCTNTLYKFKKILEKFKCPLERHYYCAGCSDSLEDESSTCNRCGNVEVNFFIRMPLVDQIRAILQRPNALEDLKYRFTRNKSNDENYEDIFDGNVYKQLSEPGEFLSDPCNISLMWNTDGVQIFKSSKLNVWPFFFKINELPPVLRNKQENVLFAGLWFGKEKPVPNLFMSPFLDDLQQLYDGIDIVVPSDANPVRVRGLTICGTCDLPAKALFFNCTQYNDNFGCANCETKGYHINGTHVYPYEKELHLRTTSGTNEYARIAMETSQPVVGVKGPTLLNLFVFNFILTTVVDDLHCIYLGITRLIMTLLFDIKYRGNPWSLYSKIDIINQRLCSISPPSFVKRLPRSISDLSYWKGSELKLWLLVYSLPILIDILDSEYFNHHVLLVYGTYLLSQNSISTNDLLLAETLFEQYVEQFENLYGIEHMTPNLHLLRHISSNVRNFGPLHVTSCFHFENLNGIFKNLVHGTSHAGLQIVTASSLFIGFANFKSKFLNKNMDAHLFCNKISKTMHRRKLNHLFGSVYIIGALQSTTRIPTIILDILRFHNIRYKNLYLFHRLLKDGVVFTATAYTRIVKTCSSCILFYQNGVKNVGIFRYFLEVNECYCDGECVNSQRCEKKYYGVINKFQHSNVCIPAADNVNRIDVKFMYELSDTNHHVLFKLENDFTICFFIKMASSEVKYAVEPSKIISVE